MSAAECVGRAGLIAYPPHPEERSEGPRLEGWGGPMLRDASLRDAPQHEGGERPSADEQRFTFIANGLEQNLERDLSSRVDVQFTPEEKP